MDFEIIGKVKDKILIYKNVKSNYSISLYNYSMELLENVSLDFIPGKNADVTFIAYPDFVYCIYQYFSKGIVHCKCMKLDANAKKMSEPFEIDNTNVGTFGENKVYTTIRSDDKQFIMVFKMIKEKEGIHFEYSLFNNGFKEIRKNQFVLPVKERKEGYDNFLLDNEGSLVFTKTEKSLKRKKANGLMFYSLKQSGTLDTLVSKVVNLDGNYLDEVNLKIDNVGKKYLLAAFYYRPKKTSAEGLFISIRDKATDSCIVNKFSTIYDSVRSVAYSEGTNKTAFDNFYIKNILVKKNGGFIIISEEYYTKQNNNLNRMDNVFYSPFGNPFGNYYYNSYYYNRYYGSPFRNYDNENNISYFYNNVLICSFLNNGEVEWNNVLEKSQTDDENDNYLSFFNTTSGSDLHFLFNQTDRKKYLLSDFVINPEGNIQSNSILRMLDKDYEFMPQFGKQVSARQIIVPCTYRSIICFARIEF